MSTIKLKGMTWSHPRGYDPMVAGAEQWLADKGVEIEWEKRSLQDFETFPVEELARNFDMIVIDHPHVGQITKEGCLLPLDVPGRETELKELADGSVGQSFPSYNWQGRQWAFPLDAATQVQAWRPDLMDKPVTSWGEVLRLARAGKVLLPLRSPHSLMCFYTLVANAGTPCAVEGELISVEDGVKAFEQLREIASLVKPKCFGMDPIAVFEEMAKPDSDIACSPLIYGYVNYAMPGFRDRLIRFADIPAGAAGVAGSALGGTGIAVSAFSKHPEAAIDFAYWIASGDVQKGLYAASNGQPGHADAWEDDTVNNATSGFYRDTRATLEGAWVRPRHDGYMPFQEAASERINKGLRENEKAEVVIADLNRLFRESF
ncbi:extracellular solute-binding protein [Brucella anthropi]|jgi:multiple sugar transport system substrate-binding protein|uniref:Extracellular solute-binding protein n=2 Tax=Brucella anthropi TaxID=529 RepID=A0A011TTA0_BRUAN|nr:MULTISPECIES: extracellular solute-binding protein [Brucella/Ochrobactrum group]EXL07352.1 ABC transporter substrate-binding protein [Brucella anthropi]KAB2740997.1 extracellular solute-binding protein [Brucella anthropi]KAB2758901.1 extracellular solute-binding protein [Brucella anthropi]KAB2770216.1 extracellular solute-binding protein [Brucella anthropi]KAB2801707.1 extracellular solute-binding protein [Brucella anthropi]